MAIVFEKSVKMGNYIAHLKLQEVQPNECSPTIVAPMIIR